jgi:hypothetical protein
LYKKAAHKILVKLASGENGAIPCKQPNPMFQAQDSGSSNNSTSNSTGNETETETGSESGMSNELIGDILVIAAQVSISPTNVRRVQRRQP